MRYSIFIFVIALFLSACSDNNSKQDGDQKKDSSTAGASDTSKKSIPKETTQMVGNTEVRINYTAPSVRGRTIWGGLVPYDQVWVTGAHKATFLQVSSDFSVGEKTIPAGKYALFTIPAKDEWTVIINRNWDQHLADEYSQSEDVARIKVKPQTTEGTTERLTYEIEKTGEQTANIIISWEKIRVAFPIGVSNK